MKVPDDRDFGAPLNALAWVCILLIPLSFLALMFGNADVSGRAQSVLIGDFGVLSALIGLKTMAISKRSERRDRGDSSGGRDG